MLDNLTIVIITNNRYSFLLRLLNFYKNFNSQAKILILDSSEHYPTDSELLNLLGSSDVIWKKYDPKIFFSAKIADGLKYIETDYAVLAADDDFLFPESLAQCIGFMELNSEYSSCHGLYYLHYPLSNFGFKNIGLAPLYETGVLGDDSDWRIRVTSYLNGDTAYYPMYAVHKSPHFKLVWQNANKCIVDWGISELAPCIISLIIGKMGVLDIAYACREPNYYVWFDHKRHHEMYSMEKIRLASQQIAFFLSEHQGENYNESYNFLNHGFRGYIDRVLSKDKIRISIFSKLRLALKIRLRIRARNSIGILGLKNYLALKNALFSSKTSPLEINTSRAKYSVINN